MTTAEAGAVALPALRDELRLLPAAANHDGSPAWMVQDPVCNRFFRIGWIDFEILLRWAIGSPKGVADAVCAQTTLEIDESDVHSLVAFLDQHSLLRATTPELVDRLCLRERQSRKSTFEWLLHNYLFFRVPLIRPQEWLATLMPWVAWIFTKTTAWVVIALSLSGLFLAVRDWSGFTSTAVDHMTLSGVVGYMVALVFSKALHEVGHAVTATRFGVRVAHMGVAMLVMFPMLYTDTSESWKLTRASQRLAIASAGILMELAIAGLATLAWSLAPDGGFKNAMFFLATTSWLLTLLVNASPFMRFDGYFILTDILDFPNLHERSGAMARTWLRRTLLGFNELWPEQLHAKQGAMLISFALVTWIYRLVVFFGIALLVYFFFFKVLGIVLMVVELAWFIAKPVWTEVRVWRERKSEIRISRMIWAALIFVSMLFAAVVPWQTGIHGEGWMHPERQLVVYSPLAGRLTALPTPGPVTQGQLLFALESPDLLLAEQRASGMADARSRELLGLTGLQDGEERRAQVTSQQDKFRAEANLYVGEQSRLKLVAPFSGVLVDLDPQLRDGVWIQPRQPLANVVDLESWTVEAFISEENVNRVRVGDRARVHMGLNSISFLHGRVQEVDSSRTAVLPHSMLDAKAGGPIATLATAGDDRRQERVPKNAIYRVKIALDGKPQVRQMQLTNVVISGEPRAWLPGVLNRVAAVAIRESGF